MPFARTALAATLVLGAPLGAGARAEGGLAGLQTLRVVESPACGCCAAWTEMAQRHGFTVLAADVADVRAARGVPEALWSCHTAEIEGYTVEGHGPFAAIDRLLAEWSDVEWLAVPGMPVGSPGLGMNPDARYDVVAFGGEAGSGTVFGRVGE